ncbi:HAD-IA family hydrolase [Novosphingobium piscinae]|uniref:HAD-IA family hydrolase n=1 Tax=Novosphingobium piscinae TaxID=1507448 RepID=A0A7X1G1W3_9SPHN|nr:HAD-IA family hydrolase [Novosphingobium piscinae]MBC2670447.1 HAD-IA family hydrolase [Novosphingobium piscinae]
MTAAGTPARPGEPRLIVFDCDGTLVDGQGAVVSAMGAAFAQFALPTPEAGLIRRSVGLSLPQAVRRLAPDSDDEAVRDIVDAYKSAFRAARAAGELSEPLFAGMAELLGALVAAGCTLGVATGKSDRGLEHCLDTHGIAHLFVTLQTADRHPSKPHPAMLEAALAAAGARPEQAVMIGDTAYDMLMAVEAGVRAIGVAWGYHEPEELIEAGAEYVAATIDELRTYLLR